MMIVLVDLDFFGDFVMSALADLGFVATVGDAVAMYAATNHTNTHVKVTPTTKYTHEHSFNCSRKLTFAGLDTLEPRILGFFFVISAFLEPRASLSATTELPGLSDGATLCAVNIVGENVLTTGCRRMCVLISRRLSVEGPRRIVLSLVLQGSRSAHNQASGIKKRDGVFATYFELWCFVVSFHPSTENEKGAGVDLSVGRKHISRSVIRAIIIVQFKRSKKNRRFSSVLQFNPILFVGATTRSAFV